MSWNKKGSDSSKSKLIRGTALLGMVAAAVSVSGQAAAQQASSEDETIIVTGSRIPQPNLVGTSPVTQVTADDITTQGVTKLEDLTNQLPQVFAAQGSNVSNGASGTAQVNLRGLGANRTLVLIDGHRMGYGSPNSSPSDLNQIPGAMVERVEVLTGGASAVYGSDAISGVVNFIMRDDFEGVRLDGQYGFYQHSNDSKDGYIRQVIAARAANNPAQYRLPPDDVEDGYSKEITAIFGVSTADHRGNITAYLGYRDNEQVLQRDRDYSGCAIANPSTAAVAGVPAGAVHWNCGGSATSFPGYFYFGSGTAYTINQANGQFVPFTPNNQYNFGPLNYYQRPDVRYVAGAYGHYEINDHAEAYMQAMFSDYQSVAQIAPSGDFFNTATINCGNPFLPSNTTAIGLCTAPQIATNATVPLYIARRNVEGGGRRDNLEYESYRLLAGLRGSLNDNWDYDVSASFSRTNLSRVYTNDFSVTRLNRALNVVDTQPGPGVTAVCQSVINGTDPNCVPYNVFTPGGVTAAALNYLQIPLTQVGSVTQQVVLASVTGDLGFGSPAAETNLMASFGVEYRRDALDSTTDAAFTSGDGAGQGGPTLGLQGSTDVAELFGEARLPLIEGGAFAELLSIDAAYRYSRYNSGTTTNTYKVGLEWAPVEDVRFRGSFQHAVRAPNIIELFGAQGAGLFNLGFDPCNTGGPIPVPAQCIGPAAYQIPAPAANLNNPAGQYNGLFGGNPNLEPEEADTITIGFVATPSFLPGFTLSVDYFSIDLTSAIAAPAASTVAACYYQSNLAACSNITRNAAARRTLWQGTGQVVAINTNIGGTSTSGFDINAAYGMDVGDMGRLNFSFIGTLINDLNIDFGAQGIPEFDCAGKWSGDANCGTPTPEQRFRARVSWETPWNVELNGTWRYFSEVARESGTPFPGDLANPTTPVANQLGTILDAQQYFDLAGSWNVTENSVIRFGVNNVLDQDPPLSTNTHIGAGFGNGNTFPQVYDALGRYVFVGATVDF